MIPQKGGLRIHGAFDKKGRPGKPLVSIITVCLNSEKHLEQTLRSVLNQTYDNIEYIIVDGGSTDRTLEIIRRYENRVACWLSEPDRGIYDAMNKGVSLAGGEWIGIINSDDWYAPETVQTIVDAAAKKPDTGVFFGNLKKVHPLKNGRVEYRKYQGQMGDFFREFAFLHPTCFVARKVYERFRFDSRFRIAGDYDLMARLYFGGVKLRHLNQTLAYFRGGASTKVSYCWVLENYRIRRLYDQRKGLFYLIQDTGVFLHELLYCTWQSIKKKLKKSRRLVIAYQILDNGRNRWRKISGSAGISECGSTHLRMEPAESIAYINRVFEDYLHYGDLTAERLAGKKVLEIGPGDNLGVALKFIASGAEQVVCLDKFAARKDPGRECLIYRELRKQLTDREKGVFDRAGPLDSGFQVNPEKIRLLCGTGIEEAEIRLDENSFDLIISRAVLEYVPDPDRAFRTMDRLLKPGGMMLHKIDLQDHGMFSGCGMHPLTFLTVPRLLYRWMTGASCKPNRKTAGYYRRKTDGLNYETRILITHLIGQQEELKPHRTAGELAETDRQTALSLLAEIRPELNAEFRRLPDEELIVSGIFLIARKK